MKETIIINSISEQYELLSLPKPEHPLIGVVNFNDIKRVPGDEVPHDIIVNLYTIAIKNGFTGSCKYGQNYYDFDQGIMTFIAPGQLVTFEAGNPFSGWLLTIHPDFLRSYPLGKKFAECGFFSYSLSEALYLSEKEEKMIETIMQNIKYEYCSNIDNYSQDVIISYIDLLLSYSTRYYNRQFITRKNANNDLLVKLEKILSGYFDSEKLKQHGLPSVQYLSEQLNLSPQYLSDMLRKHTGLNTQQHIHNKLIEKAKDILSATNLSVSEIAYNLGFEYPQSFSKLFKNKTNFSPSEYRNSFN
jgi:AraC family transcriptional regulator, transcriptional activator of pobA